MHLGEVHFGDADLLMVHCSEIAPCVVDQREVKQYVLVTHHGEHRHSNEYLDQMLAEASIDVEALHNYTVGAHEVDCTDMDDVCVQDAVAAELVHSKQVEVGNEDERRVEQDGVQCRHTEAGVDTPFRLVVQVLAGSRYEFVWKNLAAVHPTKVHNRIEMHSEVPGA
jgi:hypothetical protein